MLPGGSALMHRQRTGPRRPKAFQVSRPPVRSDEVASGALLQSQSRRSVLCLAVAGAAGLISLQGTQAQEISLPKAGDLLARDGSEGKPVALKASDLEPGKPVLAFPFALDAEQMRDGSRLNKVVLLRFDEASLDEETKARAGGGVLAFSAICTHQACDVKTWLAAEKALVCFCHSSKFLPLEGARVIAGPAPRALPLLPLKLDGEMLVVAGTFSAPPGAQKA